MRVGWIWSFTAAAEGAIDPQSTLRGENMIDKKEYNQIRTRN